VKTQIQPSPRLPLTKLKQLFSLIAIAHLTACVSVAKVDRSDATWVATKLADDQINWPPQYELKNATFKVRNEILINAKPETIWNVLIQAETWPNWYVGAKNVDVLDSNEGVLKPGAMFTWNTMGLNFVSEVTEYRPPLRLSWESRKSSIQGYHAWLIIPGDDVSKLVTEESQHGFLAYMQGIFLPNKLHKLHDVWLAEIKKKAEALERKMQ
jgi:uncharacterized protein YndB with AHSA1/START domain